MMSTNNKLVWAIALIALLNLFLLATPFTSLNWDSETHLFFADHYRHDWFDPWEEKWYGGMFVFSYPPLSHQLVALFSFLFTEESSYKIVQGLALVAFPVSMWFFVRENVGKAYAEAAALLVVIVPSVYVMLYAFGQLPSFLGIVLTLASLGCFGRFTRHGTVSALIGWVFLAGAATATHHHTVAIIMPGLIGALVLQQWINPQAVGRRTLLLRQMGALALAALAASIVIAPFIWWTTNYYLSQVQIPHPTRGNIFDSQLHSELFFWGIYGSLLIAGPIAIADTMIRGKHVFLLLGIVVLAALGLGTLTPLPRIVFGIGGLWEWLTYERFAIWASVLSVIPISVWMVSTRNRTAMINIMIPTVLVLMVLVVRESTLPQNVNLVPPRLTSWEEKEAIKFLEADNHENWNYVTLGMGEAQMARISRMTSARTIDGTYYTARQRKELRSSGIPSIDSSIWQDQTRDVLLSILSRPEEWNLKWAVLAKPEFEQLLIGAGWVRVHPLGSSRTFQQGEAAFSTVWIWQVPESHYVPPRPGQSSPDYPIVLGVIWGMLPVTYLALGVLGAWWCLSKDPGITNRR